MIGTWKKGPGADLFQALEAALGDIPILAEDLGVITPGETTHPLKKYIIFLFFSSIYFRGSGQSICAQLQWEARCTQQRAQVQRAQG